MRKAFATLLLAFASTLAQAQTHTAEELNRRAIERRAVEAVIWGIPAVNYERVLDAAIANGAKANQVVYWSKPVNWKLW